MARYLVTVDTKTRPFRDRESAYLFAYRAWRDHLSTSGGLDTRRGWNGANALNAWRDAPHPGNAEAVDPIYGFRVAIRTDIPPRATVRATIRALAQTLA